MKKILVLIVAVAFIFSVTSFCLAESWTGNITDIRGDKITIKDDKGKLRTVSKSFGCGGCAGMDLKVGNKVSVENGKIIGPSTPVAPNAIKKPGSGAGIRSEGVPDDEGPGQARQAGSAKSRSAGSAR
jgi:hypothetical protein